MVLVIRSYDVRRCLLDFCALYSVVVTNFYSEKKPIIFQASAKDRDI
jgi:hypothetical protein